MSDDEAPGWNGLVRKDAMTIASTREGNWIVQPADDQPILSLCPCCDKPFRTAMAAKRVANHVYPPTRD